MLLLLALSLVAVTWGGPSGGKRQAAALGPSPAPPARGGARGALAGGAPVPAASASVAVSSERAFAVPSAPPPTVDARARTLSVDAAQKVVPAGLQRCALRCAGGSCRATWRVCVIDICRSRRTYCASSLLRV